MGEEKETFEWLVVKRAWALAWRFFDSRVRDAILFVALFAVGGITYYLLFGLPATAEQVVPVLFFTVGPIIAFWLAVFIWHLWLSPGALVFEAIEQQAAAQQESSSTPLGTGALSVSPREKAINWAIWSQKSAYNLKQLAGILAKVDPSRDDRSPDRIAYLKLLQEEAMAGKLRLVRDRLAKSYWQPDLYPAYFSITKEDAISWAKSKNFDLSHIM